MAAYKPADQFFVGREFAKSIAIIEGGIALSCTDDGRYVDKIV
jgi:hypothetical protein